MGRAETGLGVIAGGLAGAIGTLMMGRVSTAIYDRQDRSTIRRETRARGGTNTHVIAAKRLADGLGVRLDRSGVESLGEALPYGLGATSGAVYGAVRESIPLPGPLRGLALGAVVWAVADEFGNAAAGITPGPSAFPWQTHARGLAAHLAFGVATETALAIFDRLRGR